MSVGNTGQLKTTDIPSENTEVFPKAPGILWALVAEVKPLIVPSEQITVFQVPPASLTRSSVIGGGTIDTNNILFTYIS
jgi:hypothetical protein